MYRLSRIVVKKFWNLPGLLIRLNQYANHLEKYPAGERMAFIRRISELVQKGGAISLNIEGREHFPKEGGFLVCPNHQGIFDAFAIASAVNFPLAPVIKRELLSYPVVKQLALCADAIPMDRGDIRQSIQVIREVQRRLEAARACLIFPEGTRSRGNELGVFKSGCFKPAVRARCPIVPVALVDSFLPFEGHAKGPVMVYLHVLKPLLWEDYQNMTTAQIAETVKEQIRREMVSILSRYETQTEWQQAR